MCGSAAVASLPNPPLLTQTNMARRATTLSCQRRSQAGRTTRFVPCTRRDATAPARMRGHEHERLQNARVTVRFFWFPHRIAHVTRSKMVVALVKRRTDDVPRLNPESGRRAGGQARAALSRQGGARRGAARLGGVAVSAGDSVYKRAPHQLRGGRRADSARKRNETQATETQESSVSLWVG